MSSRIPVEVDTESGFCFGVTSAIEKAEAQLASHGQLYCLGDIVHNSDEVERLKQKGLATITHSQLAALHDTNVLLRAHGEPPSTYSTALENGINIIDATCPVVLQLQRRIKQTYLSPNPPQIVIYGQAGHAEVNGLVGQTDGTAIVVESTDNLGAIDFTRPVALYSQTTKSPEGYRLMCEAIRSRMAPGVEFKSNDTICRQVANRAEHIVAFASSHSVVIFVSGKKSSNGRVLYKRCREANPRTYLIANSSEIERDWFTNATSVGICGATSTPRWLMEEVKECVIRML